MNMNRVKLGCWNIHGLSKKLKDEDVTKYVSSLDFVALVETWTTVRSNTNVSGYGSVHQFRRKRKNKGRPSGGILFLYKAKYQKFVVKLPSEHEDLLVIKIKKEATGHNRDLILFIIYVKPNVDVDYSMFDVLENNISKYAGSGDTILMGDFNARTGMRPDTDQADNTSQIAQLPEDLEHVDDISERNNCDVKINERGKQLLDLCKTTSHYILNGRIIGDSIGYFTFMSKQGCSTVDYTLVNANIFKHVLYFKVTPMSEMSDHCNTITCLEFENHPNWNKETTVPLRPLYNRFVCKPEQRESYVLSLLNEHSRDALSDFQTASFPENANGIEKAVYDFNSIITRAARDNFHVIQGGKKRAPNKHKGKKHDWYDKDLRVLRNSIRSWRRKVAANPFSADIRTTYQSKCRLFKQQMKSKQRKFKDELVTKLGTLAQNDPKSFWKTLKHMQDDDQPNLSDSVQPEDWQSHFETLGATGGGTADTGSDDTNLLNELSGLEECRYENSQTTLDAPITIREIKNILKNLKCNKAHGDDLITNEMLKYGASVLLPAMAKLFNLVLESGVFPNEWNTSFQVPIYKKGDPTDCNNYRGISITSCLGKTFNAILSRRINDYLEDQNKISNHQAAFRKNYSTIDHIYTLKSIVNKYVLKNKSKLYCCFVDFRKAFDSVWRDAIFTKLRRLGIGGKYYDLIKNMYSNTVSCVKLPTGLTRGFTTNVGIKQGDNLSPTLFNIFIDDVTDYLSENDDIVLNGVNVSTLLYADDLLILTKSPTKMQLALNKLDLYCKRWKLTINSDKTKVMVFRQRKVLPDLAFTLAGKPLEIVDTFTYLGITFSHNGNFDRAIKDMQIKAMRAMFKITSTLKSTDILNCSLYIKLFDSMIKPILLYGGQVWSQRLLRYFLKEDFGKLDQLPFEQLQNKLCKQALHVGKYSSNLAVRAELGRFPLLITVALHTIKYWVNILKSPDKIVYAAYQEDVALDKAGQANWATLVRAILARCGLSRAWDTQVVAHPETLFKQVQTALIEQYTNVFFGKLQSKTGNDGTSGNKLRTYVTIKTDHAFEKYLKLNMSVRATQAIAKIRISSHDLEIERGRMTKPRPTPANERWCKYSRDGTALRGRMPSLFTNKTRASQTFPRVRRIEWEVTFHRAFHVKRSRHFMSTGNFSL